MTRLVVEADGGSRGNPGLAGYGAVVRDARTGEVLAEVSEPIGHATNNVAEYGGLVAGLRAAAKVAPGADAEVRMDSRLVVEQMSGRWKIKHPDLRAPPGCRGSATPTPTGSPTRPWTRWPGAGSATVTGHAIPPSETAERPPRRYCWSYGGRAGRAAAPGHDPMTG